VIFLRIRSRRRLLPKVFNCAACFRFSGTPH
jgi:hypothetical protein